MKSVRVVLLLLVASAIALTGCDNHRRYRAPGAPPPPGYALAQVEQDGFRAGVEDGQRDLSRGRYQPKKNLGYRQTPGYDARMGKHSDFQAAYRRGYIRGYDQAYRRR
ncbi:MAG: hypothetical protein FWD64_01385 [Acidobacteriaceae bacterium]|nr:hypothetical protein [Acidobacteriaceae bacterium]